MKPTDHKAVLRALAEKDGCEASKRAADHIEYIERRLASALDSVRNLKEKLHKTRQQRNWMRRQLMELNHGGIPCSDSFASNRGVNLGDGVVSNFSDVQIL
jgi:chromosome segregation ATPase